MFLVSTPITAGQTEILRRFASQTRFVNTQF